MTRLQMAQNIVNMEARRDKHGKLTIYDLPANDGGGRSELAGINERYDHEEFLKLAALIKAGKPDEAEQEAVKYIAQNTDGVQGWSKIPAIEYLLRDICFNRGLKGAARTLQLAIRSLGIYIAPDGHVGQITLHATTEAEKDPLRLIQALRDAREEYEREYVGIRQNFWHGLENRWNKSAEIARNEFNTDKGMIA